MVVQIRLCGVTGEWKTEWIWWIYIARFVQIGCGLNKFLQRVRTLFRSASQLALCVRRSEIEREIRRIVQTVDMMKFPGASSMASFQWTGALNEHIFIYLLAQFTLALHLTPFSCWSVFISCRSAFACTPYSYLHTHTRIWFNYLHL